MGSSPATCLRRLVAGISLASLLAAACGDGPPSPAEAFCSGTGDAVTPSGARSFYNAISSPASRPLAPQRYPQDCLADRIGRLASPRAAYCEARRAAGHDALAEELWACREGFEAIARECERRAADRFFRRMQEAPVPCSELEAMLRDSLSVLAANHSPEELACLEAAIPEVVEELGRRCPAQGLSEDAAGEAVNGFASRCRG